MAQLEVQVKYCDPCRGKSKATATRRFKWFGAKYSIDVCEKHDAELHSALDKWIDVASCTTQSLATVSAITPPAGLYERPVVLPGPQDKWRFTAHAEQRMVERQVDRDTARYVAEFPEFTRPDPKRTNCMEHHGRGLRIVVNPVSKTIITVAGEQKIAVG
jgi:hypothetical protein